VNNRCDIKSIHDFLNELWDLAWNLLTEFDNRGLRVSDIRTSFNNHILIEGKFEKQRYPLPCIFLRDGGEILVQLDKICVTIAIYTETVTAEFLRDLIRDLGNYIEIFGGRNFLKTFYHYDEALDVNEVFSKLMKSDETEVQISISVPHDEWIHIVDLYIKFLKMLKKHKVKRVQI